MKKSHLLLSFMALIVSGVLVFGHLSTVLADTQTPDTSTPSIDTTITSDTDTTQTQGTSDQTVDTTVTTDTTQSSDTDDLNVQADITSDASTETPATPTITIEATKVICDSDDFSPHYGLGTVITATTATDWVAQSNGHCHLAPNWTFQWSDQSTSPADTPGDMIGEAPGFTSFGPTDANGSASVTVPFPPTTVQFHVREVLQSGYIPFTFNEAIRDNSNSDSAEFYCETDGLNYDDFEYIRQPIAGTTYHCVAFNVPTTPPSDTGGNSGGGSGGTSGGTTSGGGNPQGLVSGGGFSGGGGGRPAGQVLGASTDTPNSCGEYITSYVSLGGKNDKQNVTNLQAFLNFFLHKSLPIDGHYGAQTFAAVKEFQVQETTQVLLPWKNLGNPNLVGTGYVYKTTKRDINNIVCPALNLPMPLLP